jgi:hypothetical protein
LQISPPLGKDQKHEFSKKISTVWIKKERAELWPFKACFQTYLLCFPNGDAFLEGMLPNK